MAASTRAIELATVAALAASDKLAEDILAFDVSERLIFTDAFLLCSAANDRRVRAVLDEIEARLRRVEATPIHREGDREGRWVLLDYGDIVIHVQHAEERVYYGLERLWKDCPAIPLPPSVRGGRNGREPGPTDDAERRAAERGRSARPGATDTSVRERV